MRQPSNVKREDRHAVFIVTMLMLSVFFFTYDLYHVVSYCIRT